MASPEHHGVGEHSNRRVFLLRAGALCLSSLALAGCATRAVTPKQPPPRRPMTLPSTLIGSKPVPALKPGARVAIVAPASEQSTTVEQAVDWLEARGFVAQVMPAARTRMDPPFEYLAGSDAARAADLHAAFSDPDIGAVWCLQGGFGSWRILDLLDYDLLRKHAKPFIGYSDITALHLAIQRYAGFVTFHGPMAQDFLSGRSEPTESDLWAMVGGQVGPGSWLEPPPESMPVVLVPGQATGKLVGGNLALTAALIGSKYEIDTQDAILFFEDVNEALPRIDRMLSQLQAAGKFDSIKGVLVGNFKGLGSSADDDHAQSLLFPLLRERFQSRGIPVLAAWPTGHGDPNLTLPMGAQVTLDTKRGALRLEQAVVT